MIESSRLRDWRSGGEQPLVTQHGPQHVHPAAGEREQSLGTFEENDTTRCYSVQDKVWVHGPGREPWEVYAVKADGNTLGKSADPNAATSGDACCTSRPDEEAPAAACA